MADPAGTDTVEEAKNAEKTSHPARERKPRPRSIPEIAVRCHLSRNTSQPTAEPEKWHKR